MSPSEDGRGRARIGRGDRARTKRGDRAREGRLCLEGMKAEAGQSETYYIIYRTRARLKND